MDQYLNYELVVTQERCDQIEILESLVGLDIETTRAFEGKYGKLEGLDPYTSKIVMLQIGTLDKQYIIDTRKVNPKKLLKRLNNRGVTFIGHNLKFEYKHILHNYKIRLENLYDTMIVYQINYCGLSKNSSLAAVAKELCKIDVPKDVRLSFLTIRETPFSEDQAIYGAKDIIVPFLIKNSLDYLIEKNDLWETVKVEMSYIKVLGDIEYVGMAFDKVRWLEVAELNKKEFKRLEEALNQYVIDNQHSKFFSAQLDLFSTDIKVKIQWTSSAQVIKYFKYLGFCPQAVSKSTKKLTYTVDKKELGKYRGEYKPLVDMYVAYKEAEQNITTFGEDFFKYVHPITGRIHSDYRQILNTGRMSSNNPNLQNIPGLNPKKPGEEHILAATDHRTAFVASLGCKLANADYTGQEQIILANKSLDASLIEFYESGYGDMHSFVASKMFPELAGLSAKEIKESHPDKRRDAKAGGFSIIFGGVGKTIARNQGLSDEEGEEIYSAFMSAFPGLAKYFEKAKAIALSKPYIFIDEVTKRKSFHKDLYKLSDLEYKARNWTPDPKWEPPLDNPDAKQKNPHWSPLYKFKSKLERNGLNYPVQGTAGSMTKLAAVKFRQWILDECLEDEIYLTNIVHDELNAEAKEKMAQLAADNLKRCMLESGALWCKTVPIDAAVKIVDYWSH